MTSHSLVTVKPRDLPLPHTGFTYISPTPTPVPGFTYSHHTRRMRMVSTIREKRVRYTTKPKGGLLLNASLRTRLLTFINEALRLSVSPFVACTASLSFLWQAFTTCCVNMATPIYFIDGKCHNYKVIESREKP